jgi:hypothetical protein
LQLEDHPLTHVATSCLVALFDKNTKKPKTNHLQTLKHQKKNKKFEFK